MAFYKWDGEKLQRARRFVSLPAPHNIILRANRAADRDRVEEVDGWKWFDTPQEAVTYFNIETLAQFKRRKALEILEEQGYTQEKFIEMYKETYLEE